jgi:CTP:molybdopterin cytidylyltransferase MocA
VTRARPAPEFNAVILAGGSAARMGGADKPGLIVGGTPLLVSVAQAAAAAGAARLIIVGPPRPGDVTASLSALAAGRPGWLAWVREEPAGGGPVAGLRRGLAEVSAPWLAVQAAVADQLLAYELAPVGARGLRRRLTARPAGAARPGVGQARDGGGCDAAMAGL